MIDITCAVMFAVPLIILLVAVLLLPGYLNKQNTKLFELLKENQDLALLKLDKDRKREVEKTRLTMTMQAYERMVLFLERINPPSLLTRVVMPGQKAGQLKAMLLNNIREEYEHNMSQQLFVSDVAWEKVKAAKEAVVNLINNSAAKMKLDGPAADLGKEILTSTFAGQAQPIDAALATIKKEMLKNFN